MTYQETIEYLFNATPVFEHTGAAAYKPGLGTTLALDAHFGHPHRHYKTIHIAGTNGKGSCSHALASILQEAGLRTGLYTSPHLVDFSERIRVNGERISEQYVVSFVEDYISWNAQSEAPLQPSFFELTTAMALKYFADMQVDIAVVEVGLGGRLDCTNIITPILSVITNIAFDHTQFLGHTLEAIAGEKAGIIKPGVPVVVGETTAETRAVFSEKARQQAAPIYFAEEHPIPTPAPDFELKGTYQARNLRTILCAAANLPTIDCRQAIAGGALMRITSNTGLRGRWEVLSTSPLVVCDTGHNPAAWQYLAPQITAQPCRQRHIVFGMVDDKDISEVLAMLPTEATYYFTQASNHRAIPAETVARMAHERGLKGRPYPTVGQAYSQALVAASSADFIFIGGSSYVVGDLLASF